MRIFRFLTSVVLLALWPFAASAQTTLRVGLAEDPDILDPTLSRTLAGKMVFAALCDKLFDLDEKLNIVPQLALSHETSPDGKAVTIRLRPGVKFQDGEPLDADAAKFSLDRHISMAGSFRKPEIAAIDHVAVIDPLTIRLVLRQPFSPLISQLADRSGIMVSPRAAKEAGDKFGTAPVCAGPYRLTQRVQQDRIVAEKFADYWDSRNVHIDRIIYLPITDATVRLANLKSGNIDLLDRLLATDIGQIRSDPRLKLVTALETGYQGLTINVAVRDGYKTPLGLNPRVRQALSLAIDREAINKVVFDGEFVPGNQWVHPGHPYYYTGRPVPRRDLGAARALMAEAGVKGRFDVELMVTKNVEVQRVAEMIQAMVAEIGIDVKIRVTELGAALKQAEAGEYQMFLLAWSGRADPDGNSYIFHKCKAPQNYAGYCNPALDTLLDAQRATSDLAVRRATSAQAIQIVLEDSPIIYLYHRQWLVAHTARLQGFRQFSDGVIRVGGLRLDQAF